MRANQEKGWYIATDVDEKNQLVRVFWMTPGQRDLFRRYGDVLVHDNTYRTNRLGLPLHNFVVVDCEFKTRLVATALSRRETKEDYKWVLSKLQEATEGLLPKVMMVDQDAAMDRTLPLVFQGVHVINCIWHIQENLRKHLSCRLKERYNQFFSMFKTACCALTAGEFERIWARILQNFGGDGFGISITSTIAPSIDTTTIATTIINENDSNNNLNTLPSLSAPPNLSPPVNVATSHIASDPILSVQERDTLESGEVGVHLARLYNRRHFWAGPWVQASFTAGMRSTQRVEKNHDVLKMFLHNSKTSLSDLFKAIMNKIEDEIDLFTILSNDPNDARPMRRLGVSDTTYDIFGQVLDASKVFLSQWAQGQLRTEMDYSFGLKFTVVNFGAVPYVQDADFCLVSFVMILCLIFILFATFFILFTSIFSLVYVTQRTMH